MQITNGAGQRPAVLCAQLLLFVLFCLLPSYREIFRYLPFPLLAALMYVVAGCLFLFLLRSSRAVACLLEQRSLLWLLPLIWIVAAWLVYPIADGRREVGAGSTADDAMVLAGQAFLQGRGMYEVLLYDGAPVSPGPGWILFNLPFASHTLIYLLTPLYAIAAIGLWQFSGLPRRAAVIALLLISCSLLFWNLLVTGHDIPVLGFALLMLTLVSHRIAIRGQADVWCWVLAVLIGLFATSRIIFLVLPFLAAAFMFRFNKAAAVIVLVASVGIAAALHLAFFQISTSYQPLHLFTRAETQMGMPLLLLGAGCTLVCWYAVLRRLEPALSNWLFAMFAVFAVPLFFVALGELHAVSWEFTQWEGANYLFPVVPLLTFWMGLCWAQEGAASV